MSENIGPDDLEISLADTAALLDRAAGEPPFIVDVREAWELARGVLPGAVHRPLSTFLATDHRWPADGRPVVIYCEHGVRSLDAAIWLRQNRGIGALSMQGGFSEWRGSVANTPIAEEQ